MNLLLDIQTDDIDSLNTVCRLRSYSGMFQLVTRLSYDELQAVQKLTYKA